MGSMLRKAESRAVDLPGPLFLHWCLIRVVPLAPRLIGRSINYPINCSRSKKSKNRGRAKVFGNMKLSMTNVEKVDA